MEYGLSLGSNLGDRMRHLQEVRRRVASLPGVNVAASSAVYETEPVDVGPEHADKRFLNAVVVLAAEQAPEPFAAALRQIEIDMGRERTADRNAPRPVDLDVLYAGALTLRSPRLTVPHPRWHERRFVVQPLSDVRPELVLPGQTRSVNAILLALPPQPDVVLFAREW